MDPETHLCLEGPCRSKCMAYSGKTRIKNFVREDCIKSLGKAPDFDNANKTVVSD